MSIIPDDIEVDATTVVRVLAQELAAMCIRRDELAHWTHRMLQALDGYWEHCEGLSDRKLKTVRSMSTGEDWWHRYEKYRRRVEALLKEEP